jgi:antitoxin (DNA-binding transcriptional repressor) of toxin-antitoxin stability system
MKAIKVTELKAHLSKYLRSASRGTRILVKDRDEPVAELGPPSREAVPWYERMAREDQVRLGTQDRSKLTISKLARPVDIQAALQDVREDPSEVRGR